MAEADLHLSGDMTGMVKSQEFTKSGDGEITIAYSHDRCTAAWIEYSTAEDGSTKRRIPIIPASNNGASPHATVPSDAKFQIVACVGAKGHMRARIFY